MVRSVEEGFPRYRVVGPPPYQRRGSSLATVLADLGASLYICTGDSRPRHHNHVLELPVSPFLRSDVKITTIGTAPLVEVSTATKATCEPRHWGDN